MEPPVLSRLIVEDFPDAPSWLPRLFTILNRFMEQTIAVLDKNVSFGQNIRCREYATQVSTGPNYTSGSFDNVSFSWGRGSLPKSCRLEKITRADGQPFLGSVGTLQWTYTNENIVVTYVPGLANNAKYNLTFLAF